MSSPTSGARDNPTAELRRLSTLLEVSRTLMDTLHLKESLQEVLDILTDHPSVTRATLDVRGSAPEGFRIHADSKSRRSKTEDLFAQEEQLRAQVLRSGRSIVVPRLSQEPLFRPGGPRKKQLARQEATMICVPIIVDSQTEGALCGELLFDPARDYERALKFFDVVSTMVSQAVRLSRLVETERNSLLEENLYLKEELKERYDFSNIIGTSRGIQEVYRQVTQVARTNTTVLIRGESGTGKELIAHAIHYNSLRAKKPFVRVSCAALPETLIESELFGHEKGSFTDAHAQKKGRFEIAQGGSLFLDEIGDLAPGLQIKLLRVLQEKEFERVGGNTTIRANVRVIAATNKNLEESISNATFREDLYYRLNVFSIFIPPLRERKSDVMLLADHFLEKYSGQHGKQIRRISTPAIDMLHSYHWPGNVRELENTIERAVLVCEGPTIHGHHLPPSLQTAETSGSITQLSLEESISAYERDLLFDTLKTVRGNMAKAARLLGSTERIIGYKVKKYKIDRRRFR